MSGGLVRRVQQHLRRLRGRGAKPGAGSQRSVLDPFTREELQEFLAGGSRPDCADPAFREALRGDLWGLVQRLYGEGEEPKE